MIRMKTSGFVSIKTVAAMAIVLFTASTILGAENRASTVTGIISAMDEENRSIRAEMTNSKEENILGIHFMVGNLRGRPVVVVQTGIGKANAAMITTLVIEHFKPREIIFSGIAGGLNPALKPGDIVVGTNMVYHDIGNYTPQGLVPESVKNPVDGKQNPLYFAADPRLIDVIEQASKLVTLSSPFGKDSIRKPTVVTGIIATGDTFIASPAKSREIRKNFNADAVEMEGSVVAQICYQTSMPFVVIRSISDSADEEAARDLQRFYGTVARNSESLVLKTVELLAGQDKATQSQSAAK